MKDNTRKSLIILTALLFLISDAAAAGKAKSKSKQKTVPLWANPETLEQAYPASSYIARLGYGADEQTAAANAESELTTYFEHSVETVTLANQNQKSLNGKTVTDERSLQRNITVRSSAKLFAVNRTEPYFEENTGRYSVCAYIDRAQAWKIFEPKLLQAQKEFLARYKSAENEMDALYKMLRLKKARPAAENYLDLLDFAQALFPAGSAAYAGDRDKIARVEEEILTSRMEAVLGVKVSGDLDGRINRVMNDLLSAEGWQLSDRAYAYLMQVTVANNKVEHEDEFGTILTCDPGIKITLTNGTENIFTYAKTFKRISGFKAEVLDRKIFSELEKELKATFIEELNAALEEK